jgi:hypothetical protein
MLHGSVRLRSYALMMRKRTTFAGIAIALVAVVGAACSTGEDDAGGPTVGATTAEPGSSPTAGDGERPPKTAEVLRFSAPELGGGTIEGEDFSGRDVAFWFWAPW